MKIIKSNKLISIIIVIIILFSTIFFYFIQNKKYSEEGIIKEYYNTIDETRNLKKYNSLVISEDKLDDISVFPDIVEKRELVEIKELSPNDHDDLKQIIKEKYSDSKVERKFYMVEYNIKFKKDVASPIESGNYCEVLVLEKRENKWLINTDIIKVNKDTGNIIIG
ncbi:DUF4829 domain-containing protein [Clostridium ihumii]|uniref:DUF4829 domain-containing protein n=1 Tax=Clostridium ihumii TaxID=1470356 RepID=UPI00058B6543|nr:DUF4829 domain-containing protein [Clostridium ihumii]